MRAKMRKVALTALANAPVIEALLWTQYGIVYVSACIMAASILTIGSVLMLTLTSGRSLGEV